ncbi:HAMP domain-containing protein [Elusimicrobium posterum]|uniref:HAMP domain-containing protein n=1 Tax=Elusimicrobium posterum TaxID=3116653 RepID=UPI003C71D50C
MKLSLKWFVVYAATALYVIIMGGFFFYNLFAFVFDAALQNEIADEVRAKSSVMIEGLASKPSRVTFKEVDLMNEWLRSEERVQNIVYLNRDASVRWHKINSFLLKSHEDAKAEDAFPTNAVANAFNRGMPSVIMYNEGHYYDMAFPLRAANDELAGVVNLQVSRDGARALINQATVKYSYSSFIVMIIMGIVLYLFIYFKIVNPLRVLESSITSVSIKDLKLNFGKRSDEIGDVADAVSALLNRIKKEFRGMEEKGKAADDLEQLWWKSLLAVSISKGSRAIVVDQENNIMFANFEIDVKKDGPLHLLDILDASQSQVIEVIGKAMDNPGKVYKGHYDMGKTKFDVRAVQLPSAQEKARTMIVLEPEKNS